MILVAPRILSFLTGGFARAIALFPFIVVKNEDLKQNEILVRHERIHLRQQMELLVIGFYLWYGIEFAIRWLKVRDRQEAYRKISFEQEAYEFESEEGYLNKRNSWGFLKVRYFVFW